MLATYIAIWSSARFAAGDRQRSYQLSATATDFFEEGADMSAYISAGIAADRQLFCSAQQGIRDDQLSACSQKSYLQ